MKIKCVDSRVKVNISASTSVPFTHTTVQVPNLALTHTKWITVWATPLWLTLPYLNFANFFFLIYTVQFYAVSEKGWEQREIAVRNGPKYKDDFG